MEMCLAQTPAPGSWGHHVFQSRNRLSLIPRSPKTWSSWSPELLVSLVSAGVLPSQQPFLHFFPSITHQGSCWKQIFPGVTSNYAPPLPLFLGVSACPAMGAFLRLVSALRPLCCWTLDTGPWSPYLCPRAVQIVPLLWSHPKQAV